MSHATSTEPSQMPPSQFKSGDNPITQREASFPQDIVKALWIGYALMGACVLLSLFGLGFLSILAGIGAVVWLNIRNNGTLSEKAVSHVKHVNKTFIVAVAIHTIAFVVSMIEGGVAFSSGNAESMFASFGIHFLIHGTAAIITLVWFGWRGIKGAARLSAREAV